MTNLALALDATLADRISVPEMDDFIFSKRFNRKMRKLIKRQKHFYYPIINRPLKRILVAIVIVLLAISATLTATASWDWFFSLFNIEPWGTIIEITPTGSREIESNRVGIMAKPDGNSPTRLETIYCITELPDGIDLNNELIMGGKTQFYYSIEGNIHFAKKELPFIMLSQNTKNMGGLPIHSFEADKEHETIMINKDVEAELFLNDHTVNLVWEMDGYIFKISGNYSVDEMISFAESVKPMMTPSNYDFFGDESIFPELFRDHHYSRTNSAEKWSFSLFNDDMTHAYSLSIYLNPIDMGVSEYDGYKLIEFSCGEDNYVLDGDADIEVMYAVRDWILENRG